MRQNRIGLCIIFLHMMQICFCMLCKLFGENTIQSPFYHDCAKMLKIWKHIHCSEQTWVLPIILTRDDAISFKHKLLSNLRREFDDSLLSTIILQPWQNELETFKIWLAVMVWSLLLVLVSPYPFVFLPLSLPPFKMISGLPDKTILQNYVE